MAWLKLLIKWDKTYLLNYVRNLSWTLPVAIGLPIWQENVKVVARLLWAFWKFLVNLHVLARSHQEPRVDSLVVVGFLFSSFAQNFQNSTLQPPIFPVVLHYLYLRYIQVTTDNTDLKILICTLGKQLLQIEFCKCEEKFCLTSICEPIWTKINLMHTWYLIKNVTSN